MKNFLLQLKLVLESGDDTAIMAVIWPIAVALSLLAAFIWCVVSTRRSEPLDSDEVGHTRNSMLSSDEPIQQRFICPFCGGRFEMLDGDAPDYCPCCGRELEDIVAENSFAPEPYQTCPECGQKFRVTENTIPVCCPWCGQHFQG